MPEIYPLTLVDSRMIAPGVRHLSFQRDDGGPFSFEPGQFIQVHFHYDDGRATKRSYSVATVQATPGAPVQRIEIAVSYVEGGAATALFAALKEGESIQASGPYGRFCLMEKDENRRYLLVATGTGITPYRAMLPELERLMATRGVEVVLLFGARNEGELLYGAEFEAFAATHPRFRFLPCFSRQPRQPARADDRQGYVQNVLPELHPDPQGDIAYLCGNPNMVDACFALLKDCGLAIPHVRREKYVSSR
ncbi:MAG TPA: ferredoxin--NADP reductase [Xanthomonadaceae bacterium]|nr:ferredoxin--NADP reductase [Xanthomonadaceae bacterium]